LNPNFFAKKHVLNRDAYLNGCVLKRETTVLELLLCIIFDIVKLCFIVTPSKRLVRQISFCWTELDGTRVLYCHSLQAVSATNFLLLDRARWDFIVTPSKRLVRQISFCWTELDGTRMNKQSSMHQLAVLSTGWAVFFHSMSDGVHHSQIFLPRSEY
jgi:hypothetical protein